ncbi:MAG: diguanylate cyclase [Solirubrobacterales bacterium]
MKRSRENTHSNAEANPGGFADFDAIGIDPRHAWLSSAVLYGSGGVLFTILGLVTGDVPAGVGVCGVIGLAMALICIAGARWAPHASWGPHFRSIAAIVILGAGAAMTGQALSATTIICLFPIVVTAYLMSVKHSLPYAAIWACWIGISLLLIDDATARAITSTTVVLSVVFVITWSQSELRAIVRINRRLSVVDPLTGAANLRELRRSLDEVSNRSARPSVFALFAMDLDDFKQVNDRFSHSVGDAVLKSVAAEIDGTIESADLFARRGGDEFSVLVREADSRDLEALRAKLAEAIHRGRARVCPEVNPHGSVAYVVQSAGEEVDALLERCDAELHEAKLCAHPERRRRANSAENSEESYERRRHSRARDARDDAGGSAGEDLRMARAIRRVLGTAPSWRVFAVMTFGAAIALFGSAFTTTGEHLPVHVLVLPAVAMFVLASFDLLAATRRVSGHWLQAQLLLMLALITYIEFNAGTLRAPLADLYLVPIVCAAYAFEGPRALPYLAGALGLFGAALVTADYGFTWARICITVLTMVVLCGLLAKARRTTRECAARAVELSTVDALTGLANMRGLRRAMADTRDSRDDDIVALIAVDLDEFKLVNDLHSHTLGDKVLVAVADVMRMTLRNGDIGARRGGDEFVIVCRVHNEVDLMAMTTRLGAVIKSARLALVNDVSPTASISTTIWEAGEDADSVLTRSDEALHQAKLITHEGGETGHVRPHSLKNA